MRVAGGYAPLAHHLRVVAPYELGFIAALAPIYLRGRALFMQGSVAEAGREFQRILDHRGSDPFSPFCAVAWLDLARARETSGDVAGSRQAYERFLTAWAQSDSDVPVLTQARDEYARLEAKHPSPVKPS